MRQSDLALDKYCVTQSDYFRLATTVVLGMGITYGKLLLYHGVSEVNMDKKTSTRDKNNSTVYDCFNNTFRSDFIIPDINLPPINIDDRSRPHKIACYTPYLLPDTISVASENSVSNLTTPSDSPHILLITSDNPNPPHIMNKY